MRSSGAVLVGLGPRASDLGQPRILAEARGPRTEALIHSPCESVSRTSSHSSCRRAPGKSPPVASVPRVPLAQPRVVIVEGVLAAASRALAADMRRESLQVDLATADVLHAPPEATVYVFRF